MNSATVTYEAPTLTKIGNGVLAIGGSQSHAGGANLNVLAGNRGLRFRLAKHRFAGCARVKRCRARNCDTGN